MPSLNLPMPLNLFSISFSIVMTLTLNISSAGYGDLLDEPVSLIDPVYLQLIVSPGTYCFSLFDLVMTLYLYFSSAGYGECLLDKPVSLGYNRKMFRDYVTPGEAFDSSRQCSLVFGSGSHICPYMVSNSVIWGLISDWFGLIHLARMWCMGLLVTIQTKFSYHLKR